MIAFANTKGGYLLFGVDDDKKIVGVESEKETSELVNDTAANHCEPKIDIFIEYKEVDGKEIVIVKVPESKINLTGYRIINQNLILQMQPLQFE